MRELLSLCDITRGFPRVRVRLYENVYDLNE